MINIDITNATTIGTVNTNSAVETGVVVCIMS